MPDRRDWHSGRGVAAALMLGALAACTIQQRSPRVSGRADEDSPLRQVPREVANQGSLPVPSEAEIPEGPLGVAIRRGKALLQHTGDSLPGHSKAALRCFSCHLGEGSQAGALPLVGVYSRFPEYRARNALVNLLEDRINDCFERSMNGKALPRDGKDMRDIIAYFAFISRGIAPPGELPGVGLRLLDRLPPDTARGRQTYLLVCARCHGGNGAGTPIAPPLWGARSFNIGAGMARLRTFASFVRDNMPNDRAVVLNDQQAYDVAAYVVSQPRPDFARKALDWPNGDPPEDVAYPTRAATRKNQRPARP